MINISKKKTHGQYVQEVKNINKDIEVLETYQGAKIKILHKCLICNHEWHTQPSNVLNNCGCPECAKKIIGLKKSKTHNQYVEELKNINTNIEILEKYSGTDIKILHKCRICNHEWKCRPSNILKGQGCPKCANNIKYTQIEYENMVRKINPHLEIISTYLGMSYKIQCKCKNCGKISRHKSNSLCNKELKCNRCSFDNNFNMTHDDFIYKLNIVNKNINPIEEFSKITDKIFVKCNICNHIWKTLPELLIMGIGCPICNVSHGEKHIIKYLNKYNILYEPQKSFSDLKGVGGRLLSYDFYLSDYNLLIEFQGKQHEYSVEYFGGEEKFKIQQEHDKRKREYAKLHNIKLLEIWYYDINNVENILEQTINNLKSKSVETVISA